MHPRIHRAMDRAQHTTRSVLPMDLLEDAPRRVQQWCVLIALLSLAGIVMAELLAVPFTPTLRYSGLALNWLATLALFGLARWGRLPAQRLLDVCLGYEVLLAATIAAYSAELTWFTNRGPGSIISAVALLVVVFPLAVPNTPTKTAVAAVAAALTEPLVVAAIAALGFAAMPSITDFALHTWPNLAAAGLAIAISRIIYGYGLRVAEARSLGSYELIERMGEGAMGEVWRVRHELLARPAALKLIRPDILGSTSPEKIEKAILRFEREAQATAALRSPHTIQIYDFGVARDGTLYYVMELLDGLDLATLVERHGPQPPERIVFLLSQACHSLHEAHEAGLVHRDVKPENLVACRYGSDLDFVKVLDFGLVQLLALDDAPDARLPAVGKATGTAWYMPPEAVRAVSAVDRRADIYGLGCVAYQLLTGELVFEAETAREAALAHLDAEVVPPSLRTPRPVPAGLEKIVLACLEKDPERRPPDARALKHMLDALELEPRWTQERAAEWWARFAPPTASTAS